VHKAGELVRTTRPEWQAREVWTPDLFLFLAVLSSGSGGTCPASHYREDDYHRDISGRADYQKPVRPFHHLDALGKLTQERTRRRLYATSTAPSLTTVWGEVSNPQVDRA
jgi:hypothetical protein